MTKRMEEELSLPQLKKPRKQGAKQLPSFLEELPKYMTYNTTILKNGHVQEYFRIEGHPKLNKVISSTKSMNVSTQDKYTEMLHQLMSLNNDTYVPKSYNFPRGITKRELDHFEHQFVLTLVQNGKRYHMKMMCDPYLSEEENLRIFRSRIQTRFPELIIENR